MHQSALGCSPRHAQTLCLCWQGLRGSAWPGVLGNLRGVGSEQSQARKHFKHLGFQEIMLKLDPQGYPLPPKPVAKPRLSELRVGRALTINLSLTPRGCPCSLSGWLSPPEQGALSCPGAWHQLFPRQHQHCQMQGPADRSRHKASSYTTNKRYVSSSY